MNARAAVLVLAAGLFAAGCGVPGDGTVEGCVGSFSGEFVGTTPGVLTSTLYSTGKLLSTFVDGANQRMSTAMVGATGTIDGGTGVVIVTGTFNLDDCTASGNWSMDAASGTWTLEKR